MSGNGVQIKRRARSDAPYRCRGCLFRRPKIALTGFGLIFKPHATARLRSPGAKLSIAHTARAAVPRLLKMRCAIITPGF